MLDTTSNLALSAALAANPLNKSKGGAAIPAQHAVFNPEELFTSKQLADFLKIGERLPESWRLQGTGPRYIRVGGRRGRVVYRWADIANYLEGRSFVSTAEESTRAA